MASRVVRPYCPFCWPLTNSCWCWCRTFPSFIGNQVVVVYVVVAAPVVVEIVALWTPSDDEDEQCFRKRKNETFLSLTVLLRYSIFFPPRALLALLDDGHKRSTISGEKGETWGVWLSMCLFEKTREWEKERARSICFVFLSSLVGWDKWWGDSSICMHRFWSLLALLFMGFPLVSPVLPVRVDFSELLPSVLSRSPQSSAYWWLLLVVLVFRIKVFVFPRRFRWFTDVLCAQIVAQHQCAFAPVASPTCMCSSSRVTTQVFELRS